MKRIIRRSIALLMAFSFCIASILAVSADDSIIYDGESKEFVFVHDEDNDSGEVVKVMPGDTIKRRLTVTNNVELGVKVQIYVRPVVKAIGNTGDAEYLSQVGVTIAKAKENRMAYMFETADQLDENGEWILLGTLYSGGVVNLEVTLDFPVTLGNDFQDAEFHLEFKVQEFPKEPDDPQAPQTGDDSFILWCCIGAVVVTLVMIPIVSRRRRGEAE